MSIPRLEQETTISIHYGDNIARLFTSHPPTARAWIKQGFLVGNFGAQDGIPHSWSAEVPAGRVSIRTPQAKRVLAPEHRAALVAKMQVIHARKRGEVVLPIADPPA